MAKRDELDRLNSAASNHEVKASDPRPTSTASGARSATVWQR